MNNPIAGLRFVPYNKAKAMKKFSCLAIFLALLSMGVLLITPQVVYAETSIWVISPVGGETYRAGDRMTINWGCTGVDTVKIALTTSNSPGSTVFYSIVDNVNSGCSSSASGFSTYFWDIPSPLPFSVGGYYVMVWGTGTLGSGEGFSTYKVGFDIALPGITSISPSTITQGTQPAITISGVNFDADTRNDKVYYWLGDPDQDPSLNPQVFSVTAVNSAGTSLTTSIPPVVVNTPGVWTVKVLVGNNFSNKLPLIMIARGEGIVVGSINPTTAIEGEAKTFFAIVSDSGSGVLSCTLNVKGEALRMDLTSTPCKNCTASRQYTFAVGDSERDQWVFARCSNSTDVQDGPSTKIIVSPAPTSTPPSTPPSSPQPPSGGGGTTPSGTPCVLGSSQGVCIQNPLSSNTFTDLIDKIINFVFLLSFPVAAIMVMVAGFIFITGGADPKKFVLARTILIWTAIGFIIILLSKSIPYLLRNILGI